MSGGGRQPEVPTHRNDSSRRPNAGFDGPLAGSDHSRTSDCHSFSHGGQPKRDWQKEANKMYEDYVAVCPRSQRTSGNLGNTSPSLGQSNPLMNVPADIPPPANQLAVSINPPTKAEVSKAIKSLKSGKAAGPDSIPSALEADIQTSTEIIHQLLMKILENEQIPDDWKKGYLVKLPKKGDLSSCNNWWGIMLLSIPSKILTRVILERLKKALDKTIQEEQAGFCQDRSCTDHIATLRIIFVQLLEWQTPLYSVFVDFQKAFDSVDRDIIWRLMQHYSFCPSSFPSYSNCTTTPAAKSITRAS
ncbi:Transposon TX1 uncharacterized 149 kDa protein [Stylophora pistillata]|uniref:Transposon TX1 uncharacterized 149 kDa protein n=1 Tax=Stylophora pistillata TaxID=50429 RepID=A0A2B4RIT4_STYPI|nr:Transposon TX1 uncharacterized 149 kDa protein [Stylophora pistillata]